MFTKRLNIVLSIALLILLVFTLAGCGSVKESASDNSAKRDSSQTPAVQQEKSDIVIWYPSAAWSRNKDLKIEDTAISKFIKKYEEENPNVKVDEVNQPPENFLDLFKAANLAKNGPDVVLLWPGSGTTDYVDFLLPLNKYLTDEDMKAHFGWELMRKGYSKTGDVFGIPGDTYIQNIVYYNKKMFADAGISESSLPPKSWDELLTLCETLKQKNITPFTIGDKDGYVTQWAVGALLNTMVGGNYEKFIQPDSRLSGTEFEKAIDLWSQLGAKGYINKDAASTPCSDEMPRKFSSGESAMMFSGNWDMLTVSSVMKDNLGIFKLPPADAGNPNKDYLYSGPGVSYSITNYGKHPDEAAKFIKMFTSKEFNIVYCNENNILPDDLRIGVDEFSNPLVKEFVAYLTPGKNAVILDLLPSNVLSELWRMGSMITTSKISAKEVCELLDKEMAKSGK